MVTAAENTDTTIQKVCDRYFPDYQLPPPRGDARYDPLVLAIHHATDAISRLDTWIQHIREDGPHDTQKCPKCRKLFTLAHDAIQYGDFRIIEGFTYQFVHCAREGCGKMFRPIGTRLYCSAACKQEAYRARKAHHGRNPA